MGRSENTLHFGIMEWNLNLQPKILCVPVSLITQISLLHSAAVYMTRAPAFGEAPHNMGPGICGLGL